MDIQQRSLEILIYDYDQFSRDECIGQVVVDMGELDLSGKQLLWKGISTYSKKEAEVSQFS